MGQIVTMGAQLQCMFGVAPTPLTVTPLGVPVTAGGAPVATIQDFKPFVNVIPFGICNSPSNPASVSAKAVGATAPCTPTTTAPWVPGSPTVMVNNQPVLNATSRLVCALGASPCISIVSPGSAPTTQVP